jgi:glycosyltransferase involved in cell wall biosynthesis
MSITDSRIQDPPGSIMLVTRQLQSAPSGGRELLCKLNHDALKEIYGDRLVVFEVPSSRLKGFKPVINAFKGHIDGLNHAVITEALDTIQSNSITKIFVDGSNLGCFVAVAKKGFPKLQISTFFHNVEARFFLGALKQAKSLRALAILLTNYLAERKSVRYSDKIICLSERDSRLLQKTYGRGATHVSPMAMQDRAPAGFAQLESNSAETFALFVGGNFYANRAGVSWFAANVAPHVGMKTYIVGRGLEDLRPKLEHEKQIAIVGAVDDIPEWYTKAHIVIAPIFDGSGMKTKVAEALMFGKKIIGTPEAFSGYNEVADQAGWVCATADDFVAAFKQAENQVTKSYYPELRSLYEDMYSYPAARSRLAEILGRLP